LEVLQNRLLEWYAHFGREELPWRKSEDIYHIYLSEVMLQQTQVNRVKEHYYPLFLKKFPTLKDIAGASLDEILSVWSGLGYYSRAKNLHECSKITQEYFPQNIEDLVQLPGIGKYTASAICSFGYRQNVAVVDTNIARVLKRFFALTQVSDSVVWKYATKFLNFRDARSHNLALMDLGAMVCLPKNPKCEMCPLASGCKGRGDPEFYTLKKKRVYENLELFLGVFIRENKIALIPSKGDMYKNMLELPSVDPIDEQFIGTFKHSYTKYRLNVNLYRMEENSEEEIVWVALDKFDELPISSLTKKIKPFLY